MMTRNSITLGLIVAGMAIVGCDATPIEGDPKGRILIEDSNLDTLIAVERQSSDRIAGDLLRIRTEIRNRTAKELWVDVQVVWKGADGFEKYTTNWAPVHLSARFTTSYEIASLSSDVADYQFRIRRPVTTVKR